MNRFPSGMYNGPLRAFAAPLRGKPPESPLKPPESPLEGQSRRLKTAPKTAKKSKRVYNVTDKQILIRREDKRKKFVRSLLQSFRVIISLRSREQQSRYQDWRGVTDKMAEEAHRALKEALKQWQ